MLTWSRYVCRNYITRYVHTYIHRYTYVTRFVKHVNVEAIRINYLHNKIFLRFWIQWLCFSISDGFYIRRILYPKDSISDGFYIRWIFQRFWIQWLCFSISDGFYIRRILYPKDSISEGFYIRRFLYPMDFSKILDPMIVLFYIRRILYPKDSISDGFYIRWIFQRFWIRWLCFSISDGFFWIGPREIWRLHKRLWFLPTYQGDQIGLLFAHWAIVFVGQFLIITVVVQIFGVIFPRKKGND
jgi:hypothetical protein